RELHRRGHRQGRGRRAAFSARRDRQRAPGRPLGCVPCSCRGGRQRRTQMTAMLKGADIAGGPAYDVEAIRADFPILSREVYGKPLVYLDNGASAQKPRSVLDAMDYVYRMEYANVHRGLHFLSNAATAKYEEARESVRRFLNAGSAEEIIFTRNATEGINLVASSYGMDFHEGDEIVVSIMEHHSNIVPWHFHRERKGCVLRWAPIADDGTFLIDEFEKLLTKRTRMVAITHMSNVLARWCPSRRWCGSRTRAASRCWSTAARRPCTWPWTLRTSTAISTFSRGTRPTAPLASACSTPRRSTSTRCRPTWAAAR